VGFETLFLGKFRFGRYASFRAGHGPIRKKTAMTSPSQATPGQISARGELGSEHGKTTIADAVVQKIAGVATREVPGVYQLGGGTARAMGAIRERIPGSGGPSATQGVQVEVGEKEAAVDLQIVVDYGVSIADLAQGLRRNVINRIEQMTALSVVEVNINVDDVHIVDDDQQQQQTARVQ
jgi:uncharacterized alkaline shock family protein YloU